MMNLRSCDISANLTGAASSSNLDLDVKRHFVAFQTNPDVIFFDNSSTTQKPRTVIKTIQQFYQDDCANAGRSSYTSSLKAAQAVEYARHDVAQFVAAAPHEIAFTNGATDSLALVAMSWGFANLNDGDEVFVCMQDHSSAVLPWLNLRDALARVGKTIRIVPFEIQPVGDYDLRSIGKAVSNRTRLIALSHIHHVFGQDMQVSEIRKIVGPEVLISLDCCQSVSHIPVKVGELDVDFVSFSGHKMFAGNGTGVLFAKEKHHADLASVRAGGKGAPILSSIEQSKREAFIEKIEGGTPNIPSITSLSKAIEFMNMVGMDKIEKHVGGLTDQLIHELANINGIVFAPGPAICQCPGGYGIVSFRFEHASSSDVASALANENIQVRSGVHCRADESVSEQFIRMSMHLYNTSQDIQIVSQTLSNIVS